MDSSLTLVNNWGLQPIELAPALPVERGISYRGDAVWERTQFELFWERIYGGNYEYLFERCAPLASVIMKKAGALANGLFETVNPNTGNYVRGQYKEWDRVFEQPNPIQSRSQFITQLGLYLGIRSWCYALPVYSVGYEDGAPEAIWLLPPHCIRVEARRDKPFYLLNRGESPRRVFFSFNGKETELDERKLILLTDNSGLIDSDTLLPHSRMWSLRQPISNLIGAMDSRHMLIRHRGAIGILTQTGTDSAGPMPLLPNHKKELQDKFDRYGLNPDQWRVIISDADLKWQSTVLDVKQLGLHEEHLSCVKDIYEGYGVPFPLSAHSDQSTYNNIESAWRGLYQDTVIPEAKSIIEQFNKGLRAEENRVEFIVSFDHISYLQQSEKEKGEGRRAMNESLQIEWDAGIITKNMWLEEIGRDKVKNPIFDKYKFELTPEELGMINTDTDGQATTGQSGPEGAGGQQSKEN